MAGPVSEWIGRAPEIGASIKEKLSVLERPLAALRELQTALFGDVGDVGADAHVASSVVLPVVAFVTPAAGELLLFFGTLLFFLVGQIDLRPHCVSLFADRDAKLRFLKIMNDIEKNLAGYLPVVTIINAALGTIVAIGALLARLAQPGDLRAAGRAVELRALCRAGRHGRRAVRRRPGHLSFARPRVASRRSA